jgi:hypothetical protein
MTVVAGARNRHYLLFRAEGLSVITPAPIPLIEAAFFRAERRPKQHV